ncbi:MAG: zinc ribbon domain-containing protein [Candidatus Heimdallarchaeota archaeon]|nr:zinc ribbon domain-containing protein [Candidatus Heimdallarchaeota archaeon]
MISDKSRKSITNSALIYVLVMMVSMFIVFLNVGDIVIYLQIGFEVIKIGAIMWLAFGFLSFYKEEKNKIILITTILIFIASQLSIIVQTLYILYAAGAIEITRLSLLPTNLIEIVATLSLTVGFYELRRSVDSYAAEKRNIYKGQMSLPMGFGFLSLSMIINTIIPAETYIDYTDPANPIVAQGYDILLWVNYFLDMGSLVLMVLGFWYLRRAFLVLDKIPDELFQQMEERKQAAAQQRPSGGGIFGRRSGGLFGGFTPPSTQTQQQQVDPIEDLLIEEDPTKKKMFCVKCGLELDEDSAFCAECGEVNPYLKK